MLTSKPISKEYLLDILAHSIDGGWIYDYFFPIENDMPDEWETFYGPGEWNNGERQSGCTKNFVN